ncbi:MAG TPA: DMT family transporter [Pseudonocardia sp.]|jgi:drug/metabolite transporter (DMT)-like permease|uniref:DMT family transporter n=1 Tax=Pseudonocardia sp. TaxID=60912 RepID=UPI002F3EFB34
MTATLSRTGSRHTAPGLLVAGGAGCLSASAMFVKLAGADVATTAFLRCALALVALVPLALSELRRQGPMPAPLLWASAAAGVFLGADYLMWAASIAAVGAGMATVLINVAVVVFPVLARLFSGVPIARRFRLAAPLMLIGVALAGGMLSGPAASGSPVAGTLLGIAAGAAYAGFLQLNRLSGQQSPQHLSTPVCVATVAASAAAGLVGELGVGGTGIHLWMPVMSWVWLAALALLGQVVAWLLVGAGSARLAPGTTGGLLLLQPVLAIGLGVLVLGERPTAVQLLGCAVVIVAVWFATGGTRRTTG